MVPVLLLMLVTGHVEAQYVNIRLEIPAGIQFNSEVAESRDGGTWENSMAKVWVGMQAQENLTFLVDVTFPQNEILPAPSAYFLNDGSADFERAKKLSSGIQQLNMSHQENLIRNITPRPIYLKAWLGLPVIQGMSIKIEYP